MSLLISKPGNQPAGKSQQSNNEYCIEYISKLVKYALL